MKERDLEEIRKEIYWLFRGNLHTQIEISEGKITSFKPIKDTRCYVCDTLHKLEGKVSKLFGDKYWEDTLP